MSKQLERYPVFATRGTYTMMRTRLEAARRSHKILKSKADGITVRFRAVSREVVYYKDQIHEVMKEAYITFAEAKFIMGNFNNIIMESISLKKANLKIHVSSEHCVGVYLTHLNVVEDGPENYQLIGLGTGLSIMMKVKACFKRAVKLLVKCASLQAAFVKFDQSLTDTNRRLNATGHVVIPRLEITCCWIESELNEMEREEFFRMKKVKAKKLREAEAKLKQEHEGHKTLLGGGEGRDFPDEPPPTFMYSKDKTLRAAYEDKFDPNSVCPGRGICPGDRSLQPRAEESSEPTDLSSLFPECLPSNDPNSSDGQSSVPIDMLSIIPECCKIKLPSSDPKSGTSDKNLIAINVTLASPIDTVVESIGIQVNDYTVAIHSTSPTPPPATSDTQICSHIVVADGQAIVVNPTSLAPLIPCTTLPSSTPISSLELATLHPSGIVHPTITQTALVHFTENTSPQLYDPNEQGTSTELPNNPRNCADAECCLAGTSTIPHSSGNVQSTAVQPVLRHFAHNFLSLIYKPNQQGPSTKEPNYPRNCISASCSVETFTIPQPSDGLQPAVTQPNLRYFAQNVSIQICDPNQQGPSTELPNNPQNTSNVPSCSQVSYRLADGRKKKNKTYVCPNCCPHCPMGSNHDLKSEHKSCQECKKKKS